MAFKPRYPGEYPTLGWAALDWISTYLLIPNLSTPTPFVLTREQAEFVLRMYELDPLSGKRLIRRSVFSRPRGAGKSPLAGALCLWEGVGEPVFDGWDADGRPVGKPWHTLYVPNVEIFAVSEDQVKITTYDPMLRMISDDLSDTYRSHGFEPMQTFVQTPGGGKIIIKPTAKESAKGTIPVFVVADQTEEMTIGNGGVGMVRVMLTNLSKQGGCLLETPNAYLKLPEEYASQAQRTHGAAQAVKERRSRKSSIKPDMLWDHREAPPETDLTDETSFIAGLRVAYGDSSAHPGGCVIHDPPCKPGWADLEDRVARAWDVDATENEVRSDFLNQIEMSASGWVSAPAWRAKYDPDRKPAPKSKIVLGFDGSRGVSRDERSENARARNKPDATALVAMTLDGYAWMPGNQDSWEAGPDKDMWHLWEPPTDELEALMRYLNDTFEIVGFYGDPAKGWDGFLSRWEAILRKKLVAKATSRHPCSFWMTSYTSAETQKAIKATYRAIMLDKGQAGDAITHDGSYRLTQHVLNTFRVVSNGKLKLEKESKNSPMKIDATTALVLANKARIDAVAAGAGILVQRAPQFAGSFKREVY